MVEEVAPMDETSLQCAFEGERAIPKIDVPASHARVDVNPEHELPVEFLKVAERIDRTASPCGVGKSRYGWWFL